MVSGDTDPAVQELVAKLAGYEVAYLRHWKDKLHAPTVDALDAVGALEPLAGWALVSPCGGCWNWWGQMPMCRWRSCCRRWWRGIVSICKK